jgi:SAM-dependent methyltransferase
MIHSFRHISPRILVVGGNLGTWKAQDRAYEADLLNGIESWVFASNGTYCNELDITPRMIADFDIVIMNLNAIVSSKRLQQVRALAENRPKHVIWMTLLEGDMRSYLKPMPHLRELFDASSFVNCINIHAEHFIQSLTQSPVITLGIPYPVDGVRACAIPWEQRSRTVHICPFLKTRWNEFQVAKQLHLQIIGYERRLSRKFRNLLSYFRDYGTLFNVDINREYVSKLLHSADLTIEYAKPFKEYYAHASSSLLWLNLDDRYTWGRYVLDAAALGVPIISTISTGHAPKLFPELTVQNPFDIDTAVQMAHRVMDDDRFAKNACDYALEHIQEFKPDMMMKKLYTIIDAL